MTTYLGSFAPHVYDCLEAMADRHSISTRRLEELFDLDLVDRTEFHGGVLFTLNDDGRQALKERPKK